MKEITVKTEVPRRKEIIQRYILIKQDIKIEITTKQFDGYKILKMIFIKDKNVEICNITIYDLHLFMVRLTDMLREYINSGYAFSSFEVFIEEE